MKTYVGVTDSDWYGLISSEPAIDEVNFWQPGGSRQFKALQVGELFLFKLHSPQNFIVGGGFFAHSSLVPISLAWSAFGIGNGVRSLAEMRSRTMKYRRSASDDRGDFTIGCILLTQPFFIPKEHWIPVPKDWARNIVQGKTYDLETEPGRTLFHEVRAAISTDIHEVQPPRYGTETLIRPRLGQGAFRLVVTDAYHRRCAVTGERVLPVLEAAHVRPYAEGGEHWVDNGVLLRSDLHILFDRGYLTLTPEKIVEISPRIRDEFENGREYYALHGKTLTQPALPGQSISTHNLQWHNEHVFLG